MKKPSVTELTEMLAKPALIKWANKLGLQGIEVAEKQARGRSRGSSLHAQIEAYCKGSGGFERDMDRQQFDNLMQDKTILEVERSIETEWFVGRYDARIDFGGVEYIIDYKSGFKGKIYLENKLQLIAYSMFQPSEMAIVAIPQFHFFPIEIKNREPYEQMLIKLSELYQLKKEIDRAESCL